MSTPIVYMDRSKVAPDRMDEVKRQITDLAAFVERNEPRMVAYLVYLDEAEHGMTVLHVHPDSASLATHFDVAGPAFAPFGDVLKLRAIDLFGRPDDGVLERVHAKAALLGDGAATVHEHHAGFLRTSR